MWIFRSFYVVICADKHEMVRCTKATLKLNTEAQQREAVVQGRSLPPIPAPA
ncbi:MAG: hypothetical protein LBJ00_04925 [Planctomycetaceae bacterium]|nr:hypothetical protein [Planctomycetaceae bacterium]